MKVLECIDRLVTRLGKL